MSWGGFLAKTAARVLLRAPAIAGGPITWAITGASVVGEVGWLGMNGRWAEQYARNLLGEAEAVQPALEWLVRRGGPNGTVAADLLAVIMDIIGGGNQGFRGTAAHDFFNNQRDRISDARDRLHQDDLGTIQDPLINDHGNRIFEMQIGRVVERLNQLIAFLKGRSFNLWWKLKW